MMGLEIEMHVVQSKLCGGVAGDCEDAHCSACQKQRNSALLLHTDTTNLSLSSQAE